MPPRKEIRQKANKALAKRRRHGEREREREREKRAREGEIGDWTFFAHQFDHSSDSSNHCVHARRHAEI
jgi:hypothetical protein